MNFFNESKVKYVVEGIKFLFLIIIIFLLAFIIIKKNNAFNQNDEIPEVSSEVSYKDNKNNNNIINVDLKGAVKKPGVYSLKEGSIINDLIKISGGITKNGSLKNINLSKKLKDEMVVFIYTEKELKKFSNNNIDIKKEECVSYSEIISDCDGSSVIVSSDNTASNESKSISNKNEEKDGSSTTNTKKVSINTASIEELMTLNGIGESKARSIVEYRNQNGLFNTIEDIMNVSGIGEGMYNKIKEYITI